VLRGCEVTSGVSGRPSRRRRGELDGSRCLSEMRSHDYGFLHFCHYNEW
jgi:hypothetical protein